MREAHTQKANLQDVKRFRKEISKAGGGKGSEAILIKGRFTGIYIPMKSRCQREKCEEISLVKNHALPTQS